MIDRCGHCGAPVSVTDGDEKKCPRCGTRHARHDFPVSKFPMTLKIHSRTGELVWSHTVSLAEARDTAAVEVPSFAGTAHYPVSVTIEYADGTTEVGGMS